MAKKIGDDVKAARLRLGWSQEKLAQETGASTRTIARIEKNEHDRSGKLGDVVRVLAAAGERVDTSGTHVAGAQDDMDHLRITHEDACSVLTVIAAERGELEIAGKLARLRDNPPGRGFWSDWIRAYMEMREPVSAKKR